MSVAYEWVIPHAQVEGTEAVEEAQRFRRLVWFKVIGEVVGVVSCIVL